ncbi:MAG: vWA domain-containing protein [Candidatus Moraniibacteriota bacterium]
MREPVYKAERSVDQSGMTRPDSGDNGDPVADFIERNKRALTQYAGDASLSVRSAEGVMTPDGPLETCAIDLEKGEYYLHRRFRDGAYGGSEEKMLFGAFHEIEHFRELRGLLREHTGSDVWRKLRKKKEERTRYHILDNSFGDVKMNNAVVNRAPVLSGTREELYRSDLFPERDLTGLPKHLQFVHVLNCEMQIPGETWTVDPDVREEFEKLKTIRGQKSGRPILEYATHPDISMRDRLIVQDALIEPVYEKFFVEDVRKKQEQQSNKPSESGQKNGEPDQSGDASKPGSSDGKPDTNQEPPSESSSKPGNEMPGQSEGASGKSTDENRTDPENPEAYFRKEYDDYFKQHPEAIPKDVLKRVVEEEITRQNESMRDPGKNAFDAYARAQGVEPNDLRNYMRFRDSLEKITDSETGESVVDAIRELFERIISKRLKWMPEPKYPLPEGDELEYPAEAVVRTRAGETEPDVWSETEFREKEGDFTGDFDVTLVGDTSISMAENGGKKRDEQKKGIILIMEALSEFSERLEEVRSRLRHDLHVRSEGWVFGNSAECVKPLSEDLSEKDRVAMYKRLGNTSGSTKDFLVLKKLSDALTEDEVNRIRNGSLKKIVIVMTDGDSDNVALVQEELKKLRDNGVIVIGVGITEEGKSALTTYAPEARLCEKATDVAMVLGELLKEHLRSL